MNEACEMVAGWSSVEWSPSGLIVIVIVGHLNDVPASGALANPRGLKFWIIVTRMGLIAALWVSFVEELY